MKIIIKYFDFDCVYEGEEKKITLNFKNLFQTTLKIFKFKIDLKRFF